MDTLTRIERSKRMALTATTVTSANHAVAPASLPVRQQGCWRYQPSNLPTCNLQTCAQTFQRPNVQTLRYCERIFSKKARARGSWDWPRQNIACLRTSALRLVCATSINFGTPSSFGNWLRAKTAFFFTSV